MKKIFAKFKSKCTDTGAAIKKGEQMYYDYNTKKCYCMTSPTAKKQETTDENEHDAQGIKTYVEAQENAYCDNRYYSMR